MRHWTRPGRTIALAAIVALVAVPAQAAAPARRARPAAVRVVQLGPIVPATVGMVPHLVAPAVQEVPVVLQPFGSWLWTIIDDAEVYGLPPSMVEALALLESRGDAEAVSAAGAVGMLQIMPSTAAWLGLPATTTAEQIRAGVAYIAWLVRWYGVSSACLDSGPGGSDACAVRTDEVLSGFYAGPGGAYAPGYVSDVRSYWVRTKGAMAA